MILGRETRYYECSLVEEFLRGHVTNWMPKLQGYFLHSVSRIKKKPCDQNPSLNSSKCCFSNSNQPQCVLGAFTPGFYYGEVMFDCDPNTENACKYQMYSGPVLLNMILIRGSPPKNVQDN